MQVGNFLTQKWLLPAGSWL